MAQYWKDLIVLVSLLAYLTKSDEPTELLCTTNAVSVQSTRSSAFVKSLSHIQPAGISDVGSMLETVLYPYSANGSSSWVLKPLTVYVFTDGLWSPECDVVSPIGNVVMTHDIAYLTRARGFCTVQFIRFGENVVWVRHNFRYPWGIRFGFGQSLTICSFTSLRDTEIIDTEPSTRNVWKILLGSFYDAYDNYSGESNEAALSDLDKVPPIHDTGKEVATQSSDGRAGGVPPDPFERGTDVQSRVNSPELPATRNKC